MRLLRSVAVLALFAVVTAGALTGQDKGAASKSHGTLPQGWSKIGLTDDQKNKVYEVQTKYRTKIEDLQKQIAELRDKERKEQLAVLTDAQRARLAEQLQNKAGVGSEKDKKGS